jgi:hypothetical protein
MHNVVLYSNGILLRVIQVEILRASGVFWLNPSTHCCLPHDPMFDLCDEFINNRAMPFEFSILRQGKPLPTYCNLAASLGANFELRLANHLI